MSKDSNFVHHLVAFFTVSIWGTTFVSTKVLMLNGLSPAQIFTLRFSIAYVLMLCFNHKRLFADTLKDEAKMALLGITGGSLYFLSENEAMNFTTTTNTSLIVCSCPLFATLLVRLAYKDKAHINLLQLSGSLLAFAGMVIVVLNGRFVLHLSPAGDALAFTACICWSFYSLLMKSVSSHYGAAFITRKVFFYGVLTILPMFLFRPLNWDNVLMMQPIVFGNLLFLGFVASMLCFIAWNACVKELGAVKSTNYIYIIPLVTLLTSAVIINEKITWIALTGCFLILCGVYLAERKTNPTFEAKS